MHPQVVFLSPLFSKPPSGSCVLFPSEDGWTIEIFDNSDEWTLCCINSDTSIQVCVATGNTPVDFQCKNNSTQTCSSSSGPTSEIPTPSLRTTPETEDGSPILEIAIVLSVGILVFGALALALFLFFHRRKKGDHGKQKYSVPNLNHLIFLKPNHSF